MSNSPITRLPGGPLDAVLEKIGKRTGATWDQILLAWVKAKGAVAVTMSSKRSRLLGYLAAGDLRECISLRTVAPELPSIRHALTTRSLNSDH